MKQLNRLVQVMLELAVEEMKQQGVDPLVVETYRSQERQNYLYCQGRTVAECTMKGINSAFARAYCNPRAAKVTWTLNSVHKTRKAVDIVPQRKANGKMIAIWNTHDPQTQIIIRTMKQYGFEAGAHWTSCPDSPHFQVKGSFVSIFDEKHRTPYVTCAVQKALGIMADGRWGTKTTAAVNAWRKAQGYKNIAGQLGAEALKILLTQSK